MRSLASVLFASVVLPACTTHSAVRLGARSPATPRRNAPVVSNAAGPDPEAWREFRANLISGGLKVTSEEDGGGGVVDEAAAVGDGSSGSASSSYGRQSVAPANEELLKKQNAALYAEYLDGVWAHESFSPFPEVGGLLVRQPLQAQLTTMMRRDDEGARGVWGERLRQKLLAELPPATADDNGRGAEERAAAEEESARLMEQWSSNTVYTYRLAEGLISESLQALAAKGQDGRLSLSALSYEQRELVELYSTAQDSWQEVVLVLGKSEGRGEKEGVGGTEGVVINRPIARSMSRQLALLLLNGSDEDRDEAPPREGRTRYDAAFVDRFLQAFGEEAAVYVGGPEEQGAPGMLVHGCSDLLGAVELSPGTRIYTGGITAAVDAVLEGRRSPLDFRWFIGKRTGISTGQGAWRTVACARPLALKQCLGLPKPLWHEVLELCGGEMAEISKIELLKRPDQ
jgi:hypothetical protein